MAFVHKLLVTNNNLHVPDVESTNQTKSHQAVSFYVAPSLYEYYVPGVKKERNVSPRKRSLSQNMHELHVQSPTYLNVQRTIAALNAAWTIFNAK